MKKRMIKHLTTMLLSGVALASTPAQALVINLIDIGGVNGSSAQTGFNIAAKYWESVFTDNAVVNLEVGYSALGPGILGSTGSNLFEFVPISAYKALLAGDQTSLLDATAVTNFASLSGTGSVTMKVPSYLDPGTMTGIDDTGVGRIAPDNTEIANTIALSTANGKALGGGDASLIDGRVRFSSDFAFDFNPTNGITVGSYDFIGVAIHEIGHALGFISGADDFDYSDGYAGDVDGYWWAYGLDMFRYNADGMLDITPGDETFFSIDGGASAHLGAGFSSGTNFGDGWQASHWKQQGNCSVPFVGIMNPFICNGRAAVIKAADLAAFDAIGWDLAAGVRDNSSYSMTTAQIYSAFAAPVPELSTWVQMALGFGLFGGMLRRKRVRTSVRFA